MHLSYISLSQFHSAAALFWKVNHRRKKNITQQIFDNFQWKSIISSRHRLLLHRPCLFTYYVFQKHTQHSNVIIFSFKLLLAMSLTQFLHFSFVPTIQTVLSMLSVRKNKQARHTKIWVYLSTLHELVTWRWVNFTFSVMLLFFFLFLFLFSAFFCVHCFDFASFLFFSSLGLIL